MNPFSLIDGALAVAGEILRLIPAREQKIVELRNNHHAELRALRENHRHEERIARINSRRQDAAPR